VDEIMPANAEWGKSRWGYVEDIADAHRYSREEALQVCLATMPTRHDYPVADLPVRLDDIELLSSALCRI
jgi:hypothetical protein